MADGKKSAKNQKLIIIIVLVLILVGAGAYFLMGNKTVKEGSQGEGGNALTSIKDALSRSVSLECEYTDAEGKASKAYIKNGAVRADVSSSNPEEAGSVILKDKKMYMWTGKEGFVVTMPDETPEGGESDSKVDEQQDLMKDLEEYKDSCKVAVVSDSLFTPPADVKFSDMPNFGAPANNSVPAEGEMSEEKIKEMMKQYQTEE